MANFVSSALIISVFLHNVYMQTFSDVISGATSTDIDSLSNATAAMTSLQTTNISQQTVTHPMPVFNISDDQPLPYNWDKFCSLKLEEENKLYFKCNIGRSHSGIWRLDVLRNWIKHSNETYCFEIKCTDESEISVPWPVKALNLVEITIKGCVIIDFFDDYGDMASISEIPDQLEVFALHSTRIFVRFMEVLSIMSNIGDMPKDFDCGPEDTLRVYTYQNVSYKFSESEIEYFKKIGDQNKNKDEDVLDAGKKLLDGTRLIEHKCKFFKLEHIDQSISYSKSKFHISLLTENSFFPNVRTYNLSNTGIRVINPQFKEWWTYFPKLETLDLSNNFIQKVDLDKSSYAWKAVTSLLTINLQNNNISSLTVSDFELMVKQENIFVHLEGNPLNCECSPDMLRLTKLVQSDKKWMQPEYVRYRYLRKLKCMRPKIAVGKEFIKLDNSSLSCPVKLQKVVEGGYVPLELVVLLSIAVVILIIIVIILSKFRREIRILTYTRFNIILPCQPIEKYENKIYDAFVSYSSAQEDWVTETFEKLENSESGRFPQFRFCLHHRDFIPGKTIFDNVIDSVEASRHTVIILSKEFLKSNFCLYEFHEAFQQSIIERKRHLVVVMMEEIPEKDLPNDLRRCLKTFTYIKKDDVIFQDRLLYALSYKGRHRSMVGSVSDINSNKSYPSISTCDSVISDCSTQSPSVISIDSVFPPSYNEKRENEELYV